MAWMALILIGEFCLGVLRPVHVVLILKAREYPVAPERSGRPEDYANFPTFLSNMRRAFHNAGHSYGITITLPSSYWYLKNFDIKRLEGVVDWLNIMTYDIHGTWDATK